MRLDQKSILPAYALAVVGITFILLGDLIRYVDDQIAAACDDLGEPLG